jgi:hypothetical protein
MTGRAPLSALVLAAWSLAAAGAARGDAGVPPAGPRAAGLSAARRLVDSSARGGAPVQVGLGSGYGYTESVLGAGDGHHRLSGVLVIEGAPLEWLGLGLRLDGRYDHHAFASGPSDDGWVGEPRLYAQADRRLGAATSVGGRATLVLPGADAPSVRPSAASGELLALATHSHGALTVTGNAGFRLDRSANAATDARTLAPGDRLALGVSDFNAALLGVGAGVELGRWQLYGEWSWEALVGGGAPPASTWPMRLGAGARRGLLPNLDAELLVEASPSKRPPMDASAPLVPVGPRMGVMAGLVWAVGAPERLARRRARADIDIPQVLVPELVVTVTAAGALPADARVRLRRPGDADGRALTGEGGARFVGRGLAAGAGTVAVEAEGFEAAEAPVQLVAGQRASVEIALERRLPSGQIRGMVRSFRGRPLTATVRVVPRPAGGDVAALLAVPRELRASGGRFELDAAPGRYEVTIEAPGHAPQTRAVDVEQNGVTVLNADLRRAR